MKIVTMALRFDSVPPLVSLYARELRLPTYPAGLQGRCVWRPLTEEETEAPSDSMLCLRSYSEEAAELGFALRSVMICGL